jgi:hypothetical protein
MALTRVYLAKDLGDAEGARVLLQEAGIRVVMKDAGWQVSGPFPSLWVAREDLPRARALLNVLQDRPGDGD